MTLNSMFDQFVSSVGGEIMFIKILLFLIIFILVFYAINKSFGKDNKSMTVILSLTSSIIAVFYLSNELISKYLLIPYQALGIILVLGLPLLIVFFMTYRSGISPIGRKSIWGLFGLVYGYMWWQTRQTLSPLETKIMFVTAIIIIIMISYDEAIKDFARKRIK